MDTLILHIALHYRARYDSRHIAEAADTFRACGSWTPALQRTEAQWYAGLTENGWSYEEAAEFLREVQRRLNGRQRSRVR